MTTALSLPGKRALFVGCARDCAVPLYFVLNNIAGLSSLFDESAHVFVESGSADSTRAVLDTWCRQQPQARTVPPQGPDASSPRRCARLAAARGTYTAIAAAEFSQFDYLIALDMDEVNMAPIEPAAMQAAIAFLDSQADCAGVFANSRGVYYDIWALRDAAHFPRDPWEEVCDAVLAQGVSDQQAFDTIIGRRLFSLPPQAPLMAVESAFGGLGIYRMADIVANPARHVGTRIKQLPPAWAARTSFATPDGRIGWECCEHVAFHAGLRQMGKTLFVLPFLFNGLAEARRPVPHSWRSLLIDIREPA